MATKRKYGDDRDYFTPLTQKAARIFGSIASETTPASNAEHLDVTQKFEESMTAQEPGSSHLGSLRRCGGYAQKASYDFLSRPTPSSDESKSDVSSFGSFQHRDSRLGKVQSTVESEVTPQSEGISRDPLRRYRPSAQDFIRPDRNELDEWLHEIPLITKPATGDEQGSDEESLEADNESQLEREREENRQLTKRLDRGRRRMISYCGQINALKEKYDTDMQEMRGANSHLQFELRRCEQENVRLLWRAPDKAASYASFLEAKIDNLRLKFDTETLLAREEARSRAENIKADYEKRLEANVSEMEAEHSKRLDTIQQDHETELADQRQWLKAKYRERLELANDVRKRQLREQEEKHIAEMDSTEDMWRLHGEGLQAELDFERFGE